VRSLIDHYSAAAGPLCRAHDGRDATTARRANAPSTALPSGLDGLRALAVGAVLAYHLGAPWAGGGFLGVSVFFTLSGYLITSLLLREHRVAGRVDLLAFWGRRIR
jgi:peptidoglycan/LPS O-acetylase OafA/YrhL